MNLISKFKSLIHILCLSTITLLSVAISTNKAHSQKIISALGGIDTNFVIQSDSTKLDVLKQCIIKRGKYKSDYGFSDYQNESRGTGSYGYGYGYGLQVIYLEFVSYSKIKIVTKINPVSDKEFYQVDLFDTKDKLLLKVKLNLDYIKQNTNYDDLTTYSINLNKIPIVLLDITKTIEIARINPNE